MPVVAVIVVVATVLVMDVTMVMTTMLIMHMAMIVFAMGMMIMAAAVMAMAVPVIMRTRRFMWGRIGAAFGIERRLDLDDTGAETLHHLLDDMVAADAQPLGHDLRRQMAIAEMPCEAHEMPGIGAANLDQRLWRSHHLDTAAIFQHQGIAAAQGDGVFEIEQEFQSARPRHHHTATMAIVEIENDGVDGRFNPVILAENGSRADHGVSRLV